MGSINPQRWANQVTRGPGDTVPTYPTNAPIGTSSMLCYAQNNNFTDCEFVVKADTGPLAALYGYMAPNAILNAGGRADDVRCYPGTRKEVIGRINKWRKDAQAGITSNRMFWLSGPAGAGKTAIVQTVAESWQNDGMHSANFFFFRSDVSRNHPHSLVSTLLYQIFEFYPTAREAVGKVLTSKPRILEASIKQQFEQLICSPLRCIDLPFSEPIFLLIDGLDECESEEKRFQGQILHALDALVSPDDLPVFVLVGSRVEHQISVAFKELRSTVEAVFLDGEYSAWEDIEIFVSAEFDRIKRTHPLAPQDENWPSTSTIDDIVRRSSGQFIYAATVMRFILLSPSDPNLSLARVQGAARIPTKSPFAHLDAMYTYILSQAEDQEVLKGILGAYSVCRLPPIADQMGLVGAKFKAALCSYNSNCSESDIHSCLASIATIARLVDGKLSFYHSSLGDYLKTPSRSGQYFCDVDAYMIKILPVLCKGNRGRDLDHTCHFLAMECVILLLQRRRLSPNVWSVFLSMDPLNDPRRLLLSLMQEIHRYCVSDDDEAKYKQVLLKRIHYWQFVRPTPELFFDTLQTMPYAIDLLEMAEIDHLGDVPSIETDNIWRHELDRREIAVGRWLRSIYERHYPHRLETYKRLMSQWTSWAVANNITLRAQETDLPLAEQYYQEAVMAQRGQGRGVA